MKNSAAGSYVAYKTKHMHPKSSPGKMYKLGSPKRTGKRRYILVWTEISIFYHHQIDLNKIFNRDTHIFTTFEKAFKGVTLITVISNPTL